MTPGYRLVMAAPPVPDYLRLRREAALSPKNHAQAASALPGSWAACHVMVDLSGEIVGMGRLLGDGGWYFPSSTWQSIPSINDGGWATRSSLPCCPSR